jgi:nicotianamine aminotransferase
LTGVTCFFFFANFIIDRRKTGEYWFFYCCFLKNSALAEHLSSDLPYKLSTDDIFLTAGGTQAIEVVVSVLAQPGANILLPRPGYPNYEARAGLHNLQVRHFDLIPERGWEIDIDSLESIADKNTTAMVIINPNNPCGSVYTREHLAKAWLLISLTI